MAAERTSGIGRGGGADKELPLIERVRAGDVEAFEELYRIYHPRLTRFLSNFIRRPQLVEEVLDDTLMVVWDRARSFNGASKLSTWIFGIAYRKAMKAVRRQDEPIDDSAGCERVDPGMGPEEQVGQQRLHGLLARAMEELSPHHRAVLTLTYYHEMGYREIARIMDCPVDTVKTRMFHARRHLKRRLDGELADWI